MFREAKEWWVEGLLGDEYTQAHDEFAGLHAADDGTVRRDTCCLAVLTDIAIKHGCEGIRWDPNDPSTLLIRRDKEHYDDDEYMTDYDALIDGDPYDIWGDGDLPTPVMEWAGLSDSNPTLDGVEAIERNDSRGESFADIARAITDDPDL
jgi:hypothetical protein